MLKSVIVLRCVFSLGSFLFSHWRCHRGYSRRTSSL